MRLATALTLAAALAAAPASGDPSVALTALDDGFDVSVTVDEAAASVLCTAWLDHIEELPEVADVEARLRYTEPHNAYAYGCAYVEGGGTSLAMRGMPSNQTYVVACVARASSDGSASMAIANGTTTGTADAQLRHNAPRLRSSATIPSRWWRGQELEPQPSFSVGYSGDSSDDAVVDTTAQEVEVVFEWRNSSYDPTGLSFQATTVDGVATTTNATLPDGLGSYSTTATARNYRAARMSELGVPAIVTATSVELTGGLTDALADREGHAWLMSNDNQVALGKSVRVSGTDAGISVGGYALVDSRYGNGKAWKASAASSWFKIDLGEATEFASLLFGRDSGISPPYYSDGGPGAFRVLSADADAVFANGDETDDATEYTELFASPGSFSGNWPGDRRRIRVDFPSQMKRFIKVEMSGVGGAAPIIDEVEVFSSVLSQAAYISVQAICGPDEGTVRDPVMDIDASSAATGGDLVLVLRDYHLQYSPTSSHPSSGRQLYTSPESDFGTCALFGDLFYYGEWARQTSDACDDTWTLTSPLADVLANCAHEETAGAGGSTEHRFTLAYQRRINEDDLDEIVCKTFGLGIRVPASGDVELFDFEAEEQCVSSGSGPGDTPGPGGPSGPGGTTTTEGTSPTVSDGGAVGISFSILILLVIAGMTYLHFRRRAQRRAAAAAAAEAAAKAAGKAGTTTTTNGKGDVELALAGTGATKALPSSQPGSPRA